MTSHPMTQDSEATERPWRVSDNAAGNYGCEIVANTKVKAKRVVCRLGGPDRNANAALIVTAVNERDILLAQVEELKAALVKTRLNLAGLSQSNNDVFASMVRRIDSALGDSR